MLAGVGNIYADEALFLAGVRPTRPGRRVTRDECEGIAAPIRRVLRRSITTGGSSISDYVQPDGSDGAYQDERRVYGREGEPCDALRTKIREARASASAPRITARAARRSRRAEPGSICVRPHRVALQRGQLPALVLQAAAEHLAPGDGLAADFGQLESARLELLDELAAAAALQLLEGLASRARALRSPGRSGRRASRRP